VHTHPVDTSIKDHFRKDIANAAPGGHVEAVVDDGANVTHFANQRHFEFDGHSPPESPINPLGHVVGYH
jgi:hypothetical protein